MKIYPEDLLNNRIKKILYIICGIIFFIINFIIILNIPVERIYSRKIISSLFAIISIYFVFPIILYSFIKPVYEFKNKLIAHMFPIIFGWSAVILYIILDRTFTALIISLILSSISFIFSGLIYSDKKIIIYFNVINWSINRFIFLLFCIYSLNEIIKRVFMLII
jgi:hypothetical protein